MRTRPQLPSAVEVALAPLLGAPMLVFVNAISIATYDSPGLGPRALHHLFAALEILGVAACLAVPAALVARLERARSWLGWAALTALSTLGMYFALSVHLQRQADGPLDGAVSWLLFPLYLLLTGCAVPAAHIVGHNAARIRRLTYVGLGLGMGGLVVGHSILRDDYPGVHVAILWVSAILIGATLAPFAGRRLELASKRTKHVLLGVVGLLGVLALGVAPPNDVRVQLFVEPGAVAPWVLAHTVWRPPSLDVASPVGPPASGRYPDEILARAVDPIAEDPVVVLLTVDALRADVLTEDPERFDAFAWLCDHGACFERGVAGSPGTAVSLATMFTSRYYSQLRWEWHGAGSQRFTYPAADESPRFPELLTADGVDTRSVLALTFLSDENGIARGFADERIVVEARRHAQANEVVQPLIYALNQRTEGRRFLYAHLMEPHEPYTRGEVRDGPPLERYLSEVELVDEWLMYLLRALRRLYPRRGYLIVSADHGEAFGEHGTTYHSKTLYEELVHVPLIVWGPGIAAGRHDQRVGVVDIGPTVLHLLGVDAPESFMGRSLLPLAQGLADEVPRPLFSEGRLLRAYYSGELKVIEDLRRRTVQVYDLAEDPGETRNIFTSEHERSAEPVGELRAFFEEETRRMPGYEPAYRR